MESESPGVAQEVRWQRVHPISLLFVLIAKLRQWIIPVVVGLFSATQGRWVIFGLGIAAFAILLSFAFVEYFTFQFRLSGNELQVREGIFFRRNRTVPANRIQNIDLVQNILHRLLGVAEVRIETASGKEPEAILRVLTLADVERLRASIFAESPTQVAGRPLAAENQSAAATTLAPSMPRVAQQLLLRIPIKQLALAGLTSNRGLLLVPIAVGALYEARAFTRLGFRLDSDEIIERLSQSNSALFIAGLALLGLGVLFLLLKLFSIGWYVIRFFGYQLWAVGDDLRIECGLFTKVSATIPRGRIQFISIHRSWLGRRLGLASIRIETAGGGGAENESASQSVGRRWFVPVLWEKQVAGLIELLRPGIHWTEAEFEWRTLSPRAGRRLMRFAIIATIVLTLVAGFVWNPWGAAVGIVLLPGFLWLAGRHAKAMRYARVGPLIVYRSGLLTRKCSCTFLDKIQTIRLSESPMDRRWKMATLAIDTAAAGPAEHRIEVRYLDAQVAQREFAEIRALASLGNA